MRDKITEVVFYVVAWAVLIACATVIYYLLFTMVNGGCS